LEQSNIHAALPQSAAEAKLEKDTLRTRVNTNEMRLKLKKPSYKNEEC